VSESQLPNSRSERIVTLRLPHGQMCTLQRAVLWASAALREAGRYLPVDAADTVDELDEIRTAFAPAFDDAALGREITDENVDAAVRAFNGWPPDHPMDELHRRDVRWVSMRRALAAAFSTQQQGGAS
jgi:hypothetical protein